MVCIFNCCKIINNMLLTAHKHAGADEFMPLLIYVTLKARPPNLHSNLLFIQRFRHPDRLGGETGYYFTMLVRRWTLPSFKRTHHLLIM
jgi:Rab5 GDP/GTP exchange factor